MANKPIAYSPNQGQAMKTALGESLVVQAAKEFCAHNTPPGTNSLLDRLFEAVKVLNTLEGK